MHGNLDKTEIMTRFLRYFVLLLTLVFTVDSVAQGADQIRSTHKVKRKETIFGIARMYDLSIEDLIKANPEMKEPGYELKKGAVLNIPYTKPDPSTTAYAEKPTVTTTESQTPVDDVRQREIRVGVMLPLHNINGDGKRMVEYYRGILMACDSLKKTGLSVDVHAWNAAEDADMTQILKDPAAAKCDVIFGPLYSKQMQVLSDFVEKNADESEHLPDMAIADKHQRDYYCALSGEVQGLSSCLHRLQRLYEQEGYLYFWPS